MSKKLFLFDLDGTLIDSQEDIAHSINLLLHQLGIKQKSLKKITSFIGQGVLSLLKKNLPQLDEMEINKVLLPRFEKIYSENMINKTKLYSGVREFFKKIKPQEQKVAVLTHKPKRFSVSILQHFKIYEPIFMCLGGDELSRKKPDPEGIFRIMEAAQVSSQNTVFMGDSAEDIEAGKAASVTTVAALYGFRPQKELLRLKPDYCANQFRDFFTFGLL
jgi:phosphoglycolate phosphatase